MESGKVYFRLNPSDTNYVNRIIEGYEYLGVMTTIEPKTSIALVCSTPDLKAKTIEVLESLPEVLEIISYPLDN